jgi:hypothetical protein
MKDHEMKNFVFFIFILSAFNIASAEMDDEFGSSGSVNTKTKTKTTEKSAQSVKSSAKDETRINFSGVIESGVDVISRVNRSRDDRDDGTEIRSVARGGIDISARPVKGVRAVIGIEYDKRDTFVTIDKFYGQYSISDNSQIRAGIMKKAFGLEERAGLEERYYRSRSIIRTGLRDEGFLGHDLTLQYRRNLGADWRFIGGVAMSESERTSAAKAKSTDTLRYFQNYSIHYRSGSTEVIGAAVIQHFHVVPDKWYATAFASSLSCKYSISALVSETELTFGSSFREKVHVKGSNEDVFILGIRKQEQYYINTGLKTLRQVIPVAEAALYWDDLNESSDFETQIRGGLTLGFAKNNAFQFRNTYGAILSKRDDDGIYRQSGKTKVRRYRFDSEVVVIF